MIDGHPKRKTGNRYIYVSGNVVTSKSSETLFFESNLEKNFISLLSFDEDVTSIITQPTTINWIYERRKNKYTPDVFVECKNLLDPFRPVRKYIFEVKPTKILNDQWSIFYNRFYAATKWCRERGYLFKLVTEKYIETPYLKNVNFLLQYDKNRFSTSDLYITPEIESQINGVLNLNPLSINELLFVLSQNKTEQQQFLPYIWMLIRHGKLNAELTTPLTMKTIVWNGEPPFDYNFEQSPIRRRLRSRIITP